MKDIITAEQIRIDFYGKDDSRSYDHDELHIMKEFAKDYLTAMLQKDPLTKSDAEKLSEEKFCKLHSGFFGEELDSVSQLSQQRFTGKELYEFASYLIAQLSHPDPDKQSVEFSKEDMISFANFHKQGLWEANEKSVELWKLQKELEPLNVKL